ncbi:MAG: phytanoyl-CoA dioxygenase family protein [Deltaproteobacteria bacterium]|nr:phytanoyl-CoA dioxygenase family protein [Deltaproteobacteria bacterium]
MEQKQCACPPFFFDKRDDGNWRVPWLQDLSIALKERHDVDGFSGWSQKNGTPHAQPPASARRQMLTLRIHLDDCGEENGALRVLPGTHLDGRLSAADIQKKKQEIGEHMCTSPRGGMLWMNPMLLHASSSLNQALIEEFYI